MTITAREKDLLNRMNSTAVAVQLGTLIESAESIVESEIALADGKVLVGNGSGVAVARTLSGDASIGNTGVVAIGTGVIVNADVNASAAIAYSKLALSSSVATTDLAAGSVYTHRVFGAGKFTTLGGDASETITVTGATATDIIHVNVQTKGGTPRSILEAIPGTGNVVVTLSGDPSTDHILAWVAFRAVS